MSLDSLWDDFLLKLQQLLSVGSLRPHLKRRGLLTDQEYARLLSRDGEPASVQAEHLVVILRRKGSQGPHQLLQALQVGYNLRIESDERHLGGRGSGSHVTNPTPKLIHIPARNPVPFTRLVTLKHDPLGSVIRDSLM